MPLTKVDYSKTTIYKIQHRDNDELLYVGSTTDFTRRKAEHKRKCNNANCKAYNYKVYKMIRDNGGWEVFNMIVIKEFPCQNKQEALTEEDKIMRQMKSNMNSVRAYMTPEDAKERDKQYRLEHKEHISEQQKQWRLEHKEHVSERTKKYELKNKEQIAERKKKNYELNKEQILEQIKQKIKCECGCVIRKDSLVKHKRTKKHQNYLLNMTEQ